MVKVKYVSWFNSFATPTYPLFLDTWLLKEAHDPSHNDPISDQIEVFIIGGQRRPPRWLNSQEPFLRFVCDRLKKMKF